MVVALAAIVAVVALPVVVARPFNVSNIPLTAVALLVPVLLDDKTVLMAVVLVKYEFRYHVTLEHAVVDVGRYTVTLSLYTP